MARIVAAAIGTRNSTLTSPLTSSPPRDQPTSETPDPCPLPTYEENATRLQASTRGRETHEVLPALSPPSWSMD